MNIVFMQLNRYVMYLLDNFQRDKSIPIFSHSFLLPLLNILRNAGDFVIFFFSSCMLIKKKRRWVMQLSHSYSSSRSTDYKTWILTCLIIVQFVSNRALLESTYKPHYHYQNFPPLANGKDLNREKYAILQTHWH